VPTTPLPTALGLAFHRNLRRPEFGMRARRPGAAGVNSRAMTRSQRLQAGHQAGAWCLSLMRPPDSCRVAGAECHRPCGRSPIASETYWLARNGPAQTRAVFRGPCSRSSSWLQRARRWRFGLGGGSLPRQGLQAGWPALNGPQLAQAAVSPGRTPGR